MVDIQDADYSFEPRLIQTQEQEKAYVDAIKSFSKNHDFKMYAFRRKMNGERNFTYTVFADDELRVYLKKKLQCKKDKEEYNSLTLGKITLEFKNLDEIADTSELEEYYAFCTEKVGAEFRYATIQEFSTSPPSKCYNSNHFNIFVLLIWIAVILLLSIYKYIDNLETRKKIHIMYIYGVDKTKQIIKQIVVEIILWTSAFFISKVLMSKITYTDYCCNYAYMAWIVIVLLTSVHLISFEFVDIKKTLTRNAISKKVIYSMEIAVILVIVTSNICLAINAKAFNDSIKTMIQKQTWQDLQDYNDFYLTHVVKKGFEYDAEENGDLDPEEVSNGDLIKVDGRIYQIDDYYVDSFYTEYLDKYKMKLNIPINDNGIHISSGDGIWDIIYVNKNCKDEIDKLIRDKKVKCDLQDNQYYIISKYDKQTAKKEGLLDEIEMNVGIDISDCKFITIKNNYKWITYDIRNSNLADNIRKNPVIVFNPKKENAHELFQFEIGAIACYRDKDDFEKYIKQIGYENEHHYTNSVWKQYQERRKDKIYQLIVNIIISLVILTLFNAVFMLTLKMEFTARAEEIAISKVLGKGLLSRYKRVFIFVAIAFTISFLITYEIAKVINNFSINEMIFGFGVTIINIIILILVFINSYERKSVVKILKGGR
ncbi:MAG: hypothetical protein K6G88_08780 [Lachnospiraceae bacterium]|nr:hypothetical protein [Lachnospiraceae bacterium]